MERARDAGLAVPMLDGPDLDDVEAGFLDTFWAIREFAAVDADRALPIQAILSYMSLDRETRTEIEVIRQIDRAYRHFVAEIPERRRRPNPAGLKSLPGGKE